MIGFTSQPNGSQISVLPPSYDTVAQQEGFSHPNPKKDSVDPKGSVDPFEPEQQPHDYPESARTLTMPPNYPNSIITMPVQPQATGASAAFASAPFTYEPPSTPPPASASVSSSGGALTHLGAGFVPDEHMHEQYPGLTNPFPPACGPEGHITRTRYGTGGILAAIFWFPFGLMVLHHDRKIVCTRCNEVLYDAWKDGKKKGCCGGNWAERRERREMKREYRAAKWAAKREWREEKRQMRAYRRSLRYSY